VAKTNFTKIDGYIATFDGEDAEGLRAILSTVPDAEERISYQIPAFFYHGWVFYMSAHQKHFNLACPPPCAAFEAFKGELSNYKTMKSAVIFPKGRPLPLDLIGRMAVVQAKANLDQKPKKEQRK
jgi:uncharacterized protein YdhG (YjbR/CyaY superfamily)